MCALRFLDSFDHYTTVTQKWTAINGATIVAAAARTGIAGVRMASALHWATLTLDAQGTWIIGVAFRTSGLGSFGIIQTRDVVASQGVVRLNADGTLSLLCGGAVVATSVNSIITGVYYYIEFKHIIADVAGTLEVRVDGAVWATFNGDTQDTVNPTANNIWLSSIAASVDRDDLYILDGTGPAPNNDYWGNTQIECIVPNGAGFYTEWTTLFGAATHWQAENEVPPNEDTSYVESAVLNQRDTYAMGNITPVSAQINGIQVLMRARETVAAAGNIARLYRNVAVDNQGADIALQTTYNYAREVLALDPITAVAWTVDRVNSAEIGATVR